MKNKRDFKVQLTKNARKQVRELGPDFVKAFQEAFNRPLEEVVADSEPVSEEELQKLIAEGVLKLPDEEVH